MKKLIFIIIIVFIGSNCFPQKSHVQVHKKYELKKKINYCKLPINLDTMTFSSGIVNGCCTVHIKNGVSCIDSTGMAEYYRRKKIGDTTYFQPKYDTTRVILLTEINGIMLRTEAFKVTDNGEFYTSSLYEDTLTKKHFMGNISWGRPYLINKVNSSVYLQIDKKAFPDKMHIYGEVEPK